MPVNIEIKARAHDFKALMRRAEKLSDTPVEVIPQEDVFFLTENGRLKLRIISQDEGWLIYYERPDLGGPKRSEYDYTLTREPDTLRKILTDALGVRGVVKKTRYLYMIGQTRIHLDDVDGLGHFMELEVVMRDGQSDAEGQAVAEDLMSRLGIAEADLLEVAYMDLLEAKMG